MFPVDADNPGRTGRGQQLFVKAVLWIQGPPGKFWFPTDANSPTQCIVHSQAGHRPHAAPPVPPETLAIPPRPPDQSIRVRRCATAPRAGQQLRLSSETELPYRYAWWRDSFPFGVAEIDFDNRIPAGHAAFFNSFPYK